MNNKIVVTKLEVNSQYLTPISLYFWYFWEGNKIKINEMKKVLLVFGTRPEAIKIK
jgi:hypothetical protein